MSQQDDLNAAVSALARGYGTLHDAITTELKQIADAMSATDAPNPAITSAIANINSFTAKMADDAAALTASIPAATTIAPPPPSNTVVPDAPTAEPPKLETVTVTADAGTDATVNKGELPANTGSETANNLGQLGGAEVKSGAASASGGTPETQGEGGGTFAVDAKAAAEAAQAEADKNERDPAKAAGLEAGKPEPGTG